ncbi:MAG: hypothetical protein AMXMBFR36_30640 [Acidobacteriota bacterium]
MRLERAVAVAGVLVALSAGTVEAQGSVWGKSWAGGADLPLPFGVGLTVYEQHQGYELDRLVVGIPGFGSLPTEAIGIENRTREVNLKLDAWLLPFLNAFVIFGELDGRTVVDFSEVPLPFPLGRVSIDYDGEVYGGGVVLAFGTERLFASLTPVWTRTSLSGDFESDAEAFVVAPRFGLHDERGSVWLGAMYQSAEESHAGIIALPFVGAVPFAVELSESDAWNGLVGLAVELDSHWNLELEGGFGDRKAATVSVTWRF